MSRNIRISVIENEPVEGYIETQVSRLYFTLTKVYKIKKAVATQFIDYSQRPIRETAIFREFSKGATHTSGLYNSLLRIHDPYSGKSEFAICMSLLNGETLFDQLRLGHFTGRQLEGLLDYFQIFHSKTKIRSVNAALAAAAMQKRFQLLFEECEALGIKIDQIFIDTINKFVEYYHVTYYRRIRHNHIRELHGDLHSGNIFKQGNNYIFFDFLDFDKSFTVGDICIDLSFLVTDFIGLGLISLDNQRINAFLKKNNLTSKIFLPLLANSLMCRANVFAISKNMKRLSERYYKTAFNVIQLSAGLFKEKRYVIKR